ncbi:MAG: DUF2333 family protein [Robiginitomaculum sp.]|nr:DUF2333 family protein [Robiginitomaculum sp.]MDQ7078732.1 DUF2333 family protein [Robiginitomaculum sp.]
MQIGQAARRFWSKVKSIGRKPVGDEPVVEPAKSVPLPKRRPWRSWRKIAAGIVIALVLLWPILAMLTSRIDDDPEFTPTFDPKGGSHAVAMVASLMDDELKKAGWVANAPFFVPAHMLNNMPNYQIGMVTALGRFAFELEDQIGRERGSSASDPDLSIARARLQYSPTTWILKPGTLWPTASAESQYKEAVQALRRYNSRLAAGQATFDTRPDNLLAALDRIAYDLGSASAELEAQITGRHKTLGLLDFKADKIFYRTKGRAYGYYMILKALRSDFAPVIEGREATELYNNMLEELRIAAIMQPLVVNNGTPGGQFFPNHLANQGFYILRARAKLRELTDILKK